MKLILILLAACCFTSCSTTGTNVLGVVADYAATRYIASSKTAADWQKRHDQLQLAVTDIALLNSTGLNATSLAAVAARYTSNPDVAFVISLVGAYAPATGVAAPNNPLVKQITDGVNLALLTPSPFKA